MPQTVHFNSHDQFGYEYFHGDGGSGYPKAGYETLSHTNLLRVVEFAVSRWGSGLKWLDIGCAMGFLVNFAVNQGMDAYGTDISKYAVSEGKKLFPHLQGRIHAADIDQIGGIFAKTSFDVVSMLEIAYYLPDPESALRNVHPLLQDRGRLIMTMPLPRLPLLERSTHRGCFRTLGEWKAMLVELGFKVTAPYFFVDPARYAGRSIVRHATRLAMLAEMYRRVKAKRMLDAQLQQEIVFGRNLGLLAEKC